MTKEKAASGEPDTRKAPRSREPGKKRSPGSDEVPIRLPSGEQAWVSADAFNLISEKEFRDSERLRRLRDQQCRQGGVCPGSQQCSQSIDFNGTEARSARSSKASGTENHSTAPIKWVKVSQTAELAAQVP